MTLIVSADDVRAYLLLNEDNPSGKSQYTDATISSNISAATETLEHATERWFADRPGVTYTATTMFRPIVSLPGFRTFTTVTWNGAVQTTSGAAQTVWPLPDLQQTGLYTGLQFRTLQPRYGLNRIYADPLWFDKGADVGLGRAYAYADTSQANDLSILGDGGYAPGSEPYALRHAVKVLAAFFTMRPNSILADVAITPAGGVLNYSQMPAEVADFIKAWRGGTQVVSI